MLHTSLILHSSAFIPHPSSFTPYPSSVIRHPSCFVPHSSPLIPHSPFIINHHARFAFPCLPPLLTIPTPVMDVFGTWYIPRYGICRSWPTSDRPEWPTSRRRSDHSAWGKTSHPFQVLSDSLSRAKGFPRWQLRRLRVRVANHIRVLRVTVPMIVLEFGSCGTNVSVLLLLCCEP